MFCVLIFSGLTLALLYFVETLSWLVKAANRRQGVGVVVAATNIWLYGARVLMIVNLAVFFYLYDSGWPFWSLLLATQMSLIVAVVFQFSLFFDKTRCLFVKFASSFTNLLTPTTLYAKQSIDLPLTIQTAASVVFFVVALLIPLFLTERYPAYALTSSIGTQVFNGLGTVVLLIKVEPRLYAGLDNDKIEDLIMPYLVGRISGMVGAVVIISLGYL